jgi:hypothetical protein
MTTKVLNTVCAMLAIFALAYTLYHLFPLFLYALGAIALAYGYAWLNRRIDQ